MPHKEEWMEMGEAARWHVRRDLVFQNWLNGSKLFHCYLFLFLLFLQRKARLRWLASTRRTFSSTCCVRVYIHTPTLDYHVPNWQQLKIITSYSPQSYDAWPCLCLLRGKSHWAQCAQNFSFQQIKWNQRKASPQPVDPEQIEMIGNTLPTKGVES